MPRVLAALRLMNSSTFAATQRPWWSNSTELSCPRDVRLTPDSDRTADIPDWQLRANWRLIHRNKILLFNHLVSASE
jgi:hypothetical protein